MLPSVESGQEIIQSLLEALHALPGLHAELSSPPETASATGYLPDAEITLQIAGQHFTLRVEAKRELYPRDVREVLWRPGSKGGARDGSATLRLIAADPLSPGAKELLKTERVGYYDRGGSLFLPAPGAYIYVDKPAPKSVTKAIRSLFTGRRVQVIHALLLHPREWLTGKDLAKQAQVSTATVSQVMTELERLDFLNPNSQGLHKGRQVREPARLLDQWAEHVSQVKCRSLTGAALEAALAALNARVVEEGANLAVIETKSAGDLLFREQLDGTWLASPIQVYLDLLRSEGRAKEMAQNLRRERIPF